MGQRNAAEQTHLHHISQAQLIAQSPEDDQENQIRGILQEVEGRASAFVERSVTGTAVEAKIAQLSTRD